MKRFLILLAGLFTVFTALPQGVSMRSTNGVGYGDLNLYGTNGNSPNIYVNGNAGTVKATIFQGATSVLFKNGYNFNTSGGGLAGFNVNGGTSITIDTNANLAVNTETGNGITNNGALVFPAPGVNTVQQAPNDWTVYNNNGTLSFFGNQLLQVTMPTDGSIRAFSFYGDGSHLTGVSAISQTNSVVFTNDSRRLSLSGNSTYSGSNTFNGVTVYGQNSANIPLINIPTNNDSAGLQGSYIMSVAGSNTFANANMTNHNFNICTFSAPNNADPQAHNDDVVNIGLDQSPGGGSQNGGPADFWQIEPNWNGNFEEHFDVYDAVRGEQWRPWFDLYDRTNIVNLCSRRMSWTSWFLGDQSDLVNARSLGGGNINQYNDYSIRVTGNTVYLGDNGLSTNQSVQLQTPLYAYWGNGGFTLVTNGAFNFTDAGVAGEVVKGTNNATLGGTILQVQRGMTVPQIYFRDLGATAETKSFDGTSWKQPVNVAGNLNSDNFNVASSSATSSNSEYFAIQINNAAQQMLVGINNTNKEVSGLNVKDGFVVVPSGQQLGFGFDGVGNTFPDTFTASAVTLNPSASVNIFSNVKYTFNSAASTQSGFNSGAVNFAPPFSSGSGGFQNGFQIQSAGSGSDSGDIQLNVQLNAGYTGTRSEAIYGENKTVGTGNSIINQQYNNGVNGLADGAGTGMNIASQGRAINGSWGIGSVFRSAENNSSHTNYAGIFYDNNGGTGFNCAGVLIQETPPPASGLGGTIATCPPLTTLALDNGTNTQHSLIMVATNSNWSKPVFVMDNNGQLNGNGGGLTNTVRMTANTTATVTFNTTPISETVYDTSASTIASLTINLPATSYPGQILRYVTAAIATSVTVNGTQNIGATITTLAANASVAWQAEDYAGDFARIQ